MGGYLYTAATSTGYYTYPRRKNEAIETLVKPSTRPGNPVLKPVALPAARTTGIVSLSLNEKLTRFHSTCVTFEHTREDCKTVSGLFFRQQSCCFTDSIRGSCRSSCPTWPRATNQALHKGTPRPSRGAFHVMARFDLGYHLCHLFPHSRTGNRSYFALQVLDSACLVSRFSPHRTRFSDDIATAKGQRSPKGKTPTTQPGHPRSTVGHAIPFSKLGVFLSGHPCGPIPHTTFAAHAHADSSQSRASKE